MLSSRQVRTIQGTVLATENRLPRLFRALGDITRFRIFRLFMNQEDLCVTDVARILKLSVPAASQQLRVMELLGLVAKERMGQMMCYRLRTDDPTIRTIRKMFTAA